MMTCRCTTGMQHALLATAWSTYWHSCTSSDLPLISVNIIESWLTISSQCSECCQSRKPKCFCSCCSFTSATLHPVASSRAETTGTEIASVPWPNNPAVTSSAARLPAFAPCCRAWTCCTACTKAQYTSQLALYCLASVQLLIQQTVHYRQ